MHLNSHIKIFIYSTFKTACKQPSPASRTWPGRLRVLLPVFMQSRSHASPTLLFKSLSHFLPPRMQHYLFSLPQAQHIKNKNSCSTPQAKRCAKNLNPKLFNIRRCYRNSLFFKASGWRFFKHFGFSTLFFLSPFLRSKKQRAK